MINFNYILEDIFDGHYIVDRGHLRYYVSGKKEWISPYGPRPILEIDMNTENKETWISYLQIREPFQEKYNLTIDDIRIIVKEFFKNKFNYDITP